MLCCTHQTPRIQTEKHCRNLYIYFFRFVFRSMFGLCKLSIRSEDAACYRQSLDFGKFDFYSPDRVVVFLLINFFPFRIGLNANNSKKDTLILCRRLDKSYETNSSATSIVKNNNGSNANRSTPLLTPLPLSPLPSQSQSIAFISTRRKKGNEKKRNLLKLKRRLVLSSSLNKRRIVNMDKIRGMH